MSIVEVLGTKRRTDVAARAAARIDRSLLRRLWRHGGARAGIILGGLMLILAAFGPWITPMEPNWPNYADALQGPSVTHWVGTDASGRDVASRLIDGAQRTLGAAVIVLVMIVFIGMVVGIIAGMVGGIVDTLLMRLVDVMMTLPGLVLAYAIIGLLGPSFMSLLVALVIADWAYFARLSRSYSLSVRSQPYVIAARLAGVGWMRILFTHILPGVAVPLSVVASIDLGGMVGILAGFSFLGLGVQPPYAEWGSMLAESRFYFTIAPWLLLGPTVLIVITVMAANLVGTGIRDVLDPEGGAVSAPLLRVDDLRVNYAGGVRAVRGMSFDLAPGECLALVGESGCGKTTVTRAILGLLPKATAVTGSIRFGGRELIGANEKEMREILGREIGLVWQDPFDTLNPLHSVGAHINEAWRAHGDHPPPGVIAERLDALGIPDPAERMRRYPHEWSGGMLQRAAIAAASAYRPRLIVADEPTSALDADRAETTLKALRATGSAVILVSHDLALLGRHADRVAVCYAGRIVELGAARDLTARPRHPYTIGLLASLPREPGVLPTPMPGGPPARIEEYPGCAFEPRCGRRVEACAHRPPPLVDGLACPVVAAEAQPVTMDAAARRARLAKSDVVIEARGLTKTYGRGKGAVLAVANADLTLRRGEIVGISGPSGCGKSTLLRLLAMIERPTGGNILVADASGNPVAQRPKGFAMAIFQDATGSLDARWPVWRSVAEPLTARHGANAAQRRRTARDRLAEVGLSHIDPEARPSELSVGQCQRVAIARALVAAPAFLAADEPTSALDAPVAASVLRLLSEIADGGTAVAVVSHDRMLLASFCDRVLTMRDGILT